jgi:F-type H+-transporting ATPase subunit gamma
MSSTREVRRRIRSSKNVAQITRAMEMVSASKMRRAQRNVLATRPYVDRMRDVMGELTGRLTGAARKGTLLEERQPVKHVAVVIITPDRGLCGSLVSNLLRYASQFIIDQREAGRDVSVYAVGKKGRDYIVRTGYRIEAEVINLPDAPLLEDILGLTTNVINGFLYGQQRDEDATLLPPTVRTSSTAYDEVYVLYSEFVNTLVQRATLKRLLPVEAPLEPEEKRVDYTYEPSQEEVLEELLSRFVEAQLYQAVLESIASEHSARMVAMRNATDNAKELVRDLTLSYNKARQTNITNEVSEIAGGAVAQEQS